MTISQLCLTGAIAFVVLAIWCAKRRDGATGLIAGVAFCLLVTSCGNSQWWADQSAQAAREEAAERKPHVVREVDDCKVYAFKAGDRYHYFTRCPAAQTTTDSTYSVPCGKNCTREETETITTSAP